MQPAITCRTSSPTLKMAACQWPGRMSLDEGWKIEKRRSLAATTLADAGPEDEAQSSSSSSGIIPIFSSSVTPQRRTLNRARNGAFAALQQEKISSISKVKDITYI